MKNIFKGIIFVSLFTMSAGLSLAVTTTYTQCTEGSGGATPPPAPYCSFDSNSLAALADGGETLKGNTVQLSLGAYASVNMDAAYSKIGGSASAFENILDYLLATGGALRSGILDYTYSYTITPGDANQGASISQGPGFTSIDTSSCGSSLTCTVTGSIPIELGTSLTIGSTDNVVRDFFKDGNGNTDVTSTLTASLFEADGTTAVPFVIQSPEPATFGLLGCPLIAGLAFLNRRYPLTR